MRRVLVLFLFCIIVVNATIRVWVIPHSHDDAGWKDTLQGYFDNRVKSIYDTVLQNLYERGVKFNIVEIVYFSKWWAQATPDQKEKFTIALKSGQVEFLNGGWVMHDDAVTTYQSMIDQTTLGHQFIYSTFGEQYLPKVGWSVDPFGLSAVTARMNKDMNLDYHVIARVSYEVKRQLKKDLSMEYLWQYDPSNSSKQIFTHVMYDSYCNIIPDYGWDNPQQKPVDTNNVKQFAEKFVAVIKQWRTVYKHDDIMFPFGCDFWFTNAWSMFGNFTLIANYINSRRDLYDMTVQFATASEYFLKVYPTAANSKQNIDFPVRSGDIFPYADGVESFWTGFYTSRVNIKNRERRSQQMARAAEILFTLTHAYGKNITYIDNYNQLFNARFTNGLVQHHDAVTGTEEVFVLEDYYKYLDSAKISATSVASKSLLTLLSKNGKIVSNLYFIAEQTLIVKDTTPVIAFNTLGWSRSSKLRIRVDTNKIVVKSSNGVIVPFQVIPHQGNYLLYFDTVDPIPALGISTFFISPTSTLNDIREKKNLNIISNDIYDIHYDNNQLTGINNKRDNIAVKITQQLLTYDSFEENADRVSDAYVFRTVGPNATPIIPTAEPVVYSGNVVTQVLQNVAPYITQTTTLYFGKPQSRLDETNIIDFTFTVGPLPPNKELVLRFNTDINNNRRVWTDNNGLQSYERSYRDFPNDPAKKLYPIASNFYPFVYHTFIEDETRRITILTNASRSVASLQNGALEIMLHRRLIINYEHATCKVALNDTDIVTLNLRMIIEKKTSSSSVVRANQAHRLNFPIELFAFNQTVPQYSALYATDFSPLAKDLPDTVHFLTLAEQNVKDKPYTMFRALNMEQFTKQAEKFDITSLFKDLQVSEIYEKYLDGVAISNNTVTNDILHPLQIRTYLAKLSKK